MQKWANATPWTVEWFRSGWDESAFGNLPSHRRRTRHSFAWQFGGWFFTYQNTDDIYLQRYEIMWVNKAHHVKWLRNLSGTWKRHAACLRSVSLYPLVRQSDAIHCLPRAFAHLALQAGSTNMYYKCKYSQQPDMCCQFVLMPSTKIQLIQNYLLPRWLKLMPISFRISWGDLSRRQSTSSSHLNSPSAQDKVP